MGFYWKYRKNRLIEKISTINNDTTYIKNYKYYRNNNFKKILIYNLRKKLKHSEKYNQDKNNNIIRKEVITSEGKIRFVLYKYDKKNNWIEIAFYKKNAKIPKDIMTREIEYY